MTADDGQNDDLLTVLASLRTYDVSRRRTSRLRRRCHALLQPEPRPAISTAMRTSTVFRWVIAPALGGIWCLAFLSELVRRVVGFASQ